MIELTKDTKEIEFFVTDEGMIQAMIDAGIIEKAKTQHADNTIANDILAEADRIINGERQEQYGKPEDSFALIASYWNVYLESIYKNGQYVMTLQAEDVAIMMCLLKIARTQGGQKKKDNYTDICGYAALAADL